MRFRWQCSCGMKVSGNYPDAALLEELRVATWQLHEGHRWADLGPTMLDRFRDWLETWIEATLTRMKARKWKVYDVADYTLIWQDDIDMLSD